MSLVFNLCFPHLGAGPGSVLGRRNLDFAHAAFVTHDVLLQRTEQPLGMLGREDDAALDAAFCMPGKTAAKSRMNSEVEWEMIARLE